MTGSQKFEPEGSAGDAQSPQRKLTVDAGSFVISTSRGDVIATGAPVESGVVVCLSNVAAGLAALLHFASPDSKANPHEAASQPARFADTGLELLFEEAGRHGANAGRCTVRLVGAATVPGDAGSEKVAKRNLLAARSALWRRGVLLDGEDVGGNRARRATLTVEGGQLVVELEEDIPAEHGGTAEQE
jgi:chemotaxis protein CheD